MAAAAPVIGSVIVGVLVSEAAKVIGPKIGLSDSASSMLGMVGGIAAGGMVAGTGSTAASATQAGATSSQVGTQLPAGYGGPTNPTGSGFTGTVGGGGAGLQPSGAITSAVRGASPSQAVSLDPDAGMLQAAKPTGSGFTGTGPEVEGLAPKVVKKPGVPGSPLERSGGEGMLTQSTQVSAPDTGSLTSAGQGIDDTVIKEGTVGRTGGGSKSFVEEGGTDWWGQLFTPEKTMDLAIAAMQGYSEAGMAKEDREYAEEVKKKNAADWAKDYPGRSSVNQRYPSGYAGP
jgi:hypothetical protein